MEHNDGPPARDYSLQRVPVTSEARTPARASALEHGGYGSRLTRGRGRGRGRGQGRGQGNGRGSSSSSNTSVGNGEEGASEIIGLAPTQEAVRKAYTDTVAFITQRPARRQRMPEGHEEAQKVHEGAYNIWYNKWTGQTYKGRFDIGERAATRVNVARDAGFTLADKRRAKNAAYTTYFCLLFARGCCAAGHKCEYLHRAPLALDHEETTKDCFGRARHRDEREDMGGIGSFNRENRSLYVGNIHQYARGEGERVVRKHFEVFGELERVNVIHDRAIAFVKYRKRACAEFAKEAMDHQALDAGEVLNIRWAHDDPNPRVVREERKRLEHAFVEHYVAKKAREDELGLDEETRKLVEANPTYAYYRQVEDEDDESAEIISS